MSSFRKLETETDSGDAEKPRPSVRPKIALLPKAVVDQIAAGEVVQRPVSVVKELLENSLDAGATQIIVQFDGLCKLSIIDNGKGISKNDLALLCTRHATSKLKSVDDFSTLGTFGFRGEALASTSMVSRLLTVSSRVRIGDYDDDDENNSNASVAYSQSYKLGKPLQAQPKPCARKVGTTITIEDLFYNVPHRQTAYAKKESEEYAKIHRVVQDYSLHYPTIGFVCQRKMTGRSKHPQLIVDCNTGQIPAVKALLSNNRAKSSAKTNHPHEQIQQATKQILSQILESNLANHLLYMECGATAPSTSSTNEEPRVENSPRYQFQYSAQLYFTSPSYHNNTTKGNKAKQGKFVLFLNHRLVDLPPLKRSLEEIYADLGHNNPNRSKHANTNLGKPVLLVNLTIPGCQVDVNVHPSKKQVALMYQEDLIKDISKKLQERLEEDGQAFVAESVQTQPKSKSILKNPYSKKRKHVSDEADNKTENETENDNDDENDSKPSPAKKPSHDGSSMQTPDTKPSLKPSSYSSSTAKKVAPSKLIRTNAAARAGAIEPFLVPTQTQLSQTPTQLSQNSETSNASDAQSSERSLSSEQQQAVLHVSTCPLSKPVSQVDMSQPGAFAQQLQRERCTCPTEPARRTVLIPKSAVRPKKVVPTPSKYTSVAQLRKRIGKQQCFETTTMIRKAFFMGCLSHQRSLLQCDEELVQINHFEMAKELFYQLALARFGGGAQLAQLPTGGIHIQTVVAQALQCEDELSRLHELEKEQGNSSSSSLSLTGMLEVNDSNRNLAQHVTARLVESAPMLEEYFSIHIESPNPTKSNSIDDISSGAVLTGLPVLLEGHCPQPHALPIFLLRLATQVDWTREKHCFHGVCKELGNFYAMLPKDGDERHAYVQHQLFPALSYLMLPSKNLAKNGHFSKMTKLSTLYKVFERC